MKKIPEAASSDKESHMHPPAPLLGRKKWGWFLAGCLMALLAAAVIFLGTFWYQIIVLRNEFPFGPLIWAAVFSIVTFFVGVGLSGAFAFKDTDQPSVP